MTTVLMFSGQGAAYYQMGRSLFQSSLIFKRQMQELDEVVRCCQGVSVIDELYDPGRTLAEPLLSLRISHPAIFMTGYSLAKTLENEGIMPDYTIGFSLGEFTAAAVSGAISPEEALRLVVSQAALVEDNCVQGGLLAVLGDTDVYYSSQVLRDNTTIAAINSREQFVLAGERRHIDLAKKAMIEKDICCQELVVSYGFHSPAVEPAGEAFKTLLGNTNFRAPLVPMISGWSGELLQTIPRHYLWDAVREPMSFEAAILKAEQEISKAGRRAYIDLGPSGSLANLLRYASGIGEGVDVFQIMTPFRQEEKKLAEIKTYVGQHKAVARGREKPEPNRERILAYLFPGQGSQRKGMGEGLFDLFPEYAEKASEILGYSIRNLCLNDPDRMLNRTEYTQPALYVVNALSFLKLEKETGVRPDILAGHSLGEYNALFASGAMDFETGLRLVQQRGALMSKMKDGGMAAVKGLTAGGIRQVIERHGLTGLELANYNTQNQIVLSGPKDAINSAEKYFTAAGASLYFPLNTSGAFHSSLMAPAREAFVQFLEHISFSPLRIPVISNVEATFYVQERIGALLGEQLVMPVRWLESIQEIIRQGDVVFKEVGPGDILSKIVGAIQKQNDGIS